MRRKILVTGGSGLLGHAVKQVLPEAVFISRLDYDLTDRHAVRRMFELIRPEAVLHLAASVGGVQKNKKHNADLFESNVRIDTNVLTAAKDCGVDRLISVLSSCAYRVNDEGVSTESDLHKEMPFSGSLGYGYAKRMLDIQTQLLHEQYGCRFSTVTPVTMFGPDDNWDLENGHVAGAMIHRCFLAKQRNTSLEVWGSGRAVRQFVYSLDVARILIRCLEIFNGPGTMILAPDAGMAIKDLALQVAAALDFQGAIHFDETKPEGQLRRVMKSVVFSKLFPDFKWTPFQEALASTVSWFENEFLANNPKSVTINP